VRSGRPIAIVGVPSSAGARARGPERAPGALRAAGLLTALQANGIDVVDRGDLPRTEFRADEDCPKLQNLGLVCRVARDVAREVRLASGTGGMPVVLGGDCTITIGTVAGLIEGGGADLGVLYFDGDLDLNTPQTTPSGILDGMVAAHLLGDGCPELAGIGPCAPLVPQTRLAFFGYNVGAGFVDPPELSSLGARASLAYSVEQVRADPLGAAKEALARLAARAGRFLVHFDVDATDLAAVGVPHRNALALSAALVALGVFLASPGCAGLVVTQFDPQSDPSGFLAMRLAGGLAQVLGAVSDTAFDLQTGRGVGVSSS